MNARKNVPNVDGAITWAGRYPHQVPLINGEFEFLAAYTPEVCG